MNQDEFTIWRQTPHEARCRSLIMGILNVTPNSFYDGGSYYDNLALACERAQDMIVQGVDIIDIGGESSKPGVEPVSLDEELERVIPVIERIRALSDICISIDTYKPEVMIAAVTAGATMINDIYALATNEALATAAKLDVPVCLMHMQGSPSNMQDAPHYAGDVVDEINYFFEQRITACLHAGMRREQFILDPGFGFGKSAQHNIQIIKRFHELRQHQLPLLLGVSRKSTIGIILGDMSADRLLGGLALTAPAVLQGACIMRTHDVAETKQTLSVLDVINKGLSG